eukprot:COSAG02_NODE_59_length_43585_cov_39.087752_30_plen_916_part_00
MQIVISREAAYETIKAFGRMSESGHPGLQFTDLNADKTPMQKHYAPYIRRSAEVDRILRLLDGMIARNHVTSVTVGDASEESRGIFDTGAQGREPIEQELLALEKELVSMEKNLDIVVQQRIKLIEHKEVLNKVGPVLGTGYGGFGHETYGGPGGGRRSMDQGLLGTEMAQLTDPGMLSNVVGTLPAESQAMFERLVFRIGRGNVHLRFIEAPLNSEGQGEKVVFCALFQGAEMGRKVEKVAKNFSANIFTFNADTVDADIRQVQNDLDDRTRTMRMTRDHIQGQLGDLASKLPMWNEKAKAELAIYDTLNRFAQLGDLHDNFDDGDQSGNSEFLTGEAWLPNISIQAVEETLKIGQQKARASAPSYCRTLKARGMPPTYFKTGKITSQFQAVVEAYGIARYREHSPVPYVHIMFPFMFAVMFGDVGHGTLALLFALYLIWNEKKLEETGVNEMLQTAFDGRYVVLVMALFSIYCGALYNEVFGLPVDYFHSRWAYHGNNGTTSGTVAVYTGVDTCGVAADPGACNLPPANVYPFGMDPAWKWAANGLQYTNSLKMKMSVILGVSQMVFGIILKATNDLHFKEPLDFYCEFIPQMIFMNFIFGYMCWLIIFKWQTCWLPDQPDSWPETDTGTFDGRITFETDPHRYKEALDGVGWTLPSDMNPEPELIAEPLQTGLLPPWGQDGQNGKLILEGTKLSYVCEGKLNDLDAPPDIKQILINMFMAFGTDFPQQFVLYANMNTWHQPMVIIAVLCIPIMLLPKPLILNAEHKKTQGYGVITNDDDMIGGGGGGGGHGHGDEEFDFGEVMIHQVIETIEFVLGAISNTASYLRLWALSLAHAQLTDVFWEKIMVENFERFIESSPIVFAVVMFCAFAVWMACSFGVLLVRRSTALHTPASSTSLAWSFTSCPHLISVAT